MEEKKRIKLVNVLKVISIIILGIGIILGVCTAKELMGNISNEKIYVDGSDFTVVTNSFTIITSIVMGGIVVLFSIILDVVIWIVYAIVVLKFVQRTKKKKGEEKIKR